MKENIHHWGIILAGGEGKRLREHIRIVYGCDKPKQFCAIVGTRSMLRHTIDRAKTKIHPERLLTVINKDHWRHATDELDQLPSVNYIQQPLGRETAPAILLALLHIYQRDPKAIVALLPSDHFILEEDQFMDHVESAFEFSFENPRTVCLLGMKPHLAESEYGWIEPQSKIGELHGKSVYRVGQFWEKPEDSVLQFLHRKGCLWNTMVAVGHLEGFLNLFATFLTRMHESFMSILPAIGTAGEEHAVERVYAPLPLVNFSQEVLAKGSANLAVIPVSNVYWSDWGNSGRIRGDILRFSLRSRVLNTEAMGEFA